MLWEHLGRALNVSWKTKDKLLGKRTPGRKLEEWKLPGEMEERGIPGRTVLRGRTWHA